MNWKLDHIVQVVRDLEAARTAYRNAGFNVIPGGRHPNAGVANELISLADGSYIELFSFVDLAQASPNHSSWAIFEAGGGLASFWFGTQDVEADVAKLRALGIDIEAPRSGSRVRPDGYEVKFRLAVPSKRDYPYLPALIEDVTPRSERVPAYAEHPNGVTGIDSLSILIPEMQLVRNHYAALGFSVAAANVRIGALTLEFAASTQSGTGLQSVHLATVSGGRRLLDNAGLR